jgi:hypothetical protein
MKTTFARYAPTASSLKKSELSKLTQLEDVLATAQRWQVEAAKALVEIRDKKLYRAEYSSFEKYAQGRWSYEKTYLYFLCQWGETVENLSTIVETIPTRGSHARPLYGLSPKDQRRAWKSVLKETDEPTARDVEKVAKEYRSSIGRTGIGSGTGALVYYGSKALLAPQIIAEMPSIRAMSRYTWVAQLFSRNPRSSWR